MMNGYGTELAATLHASHLDFASQRGGRKMPEAGFVCRKLKRQEQAGCVCFRVIAGTFILPPQLSASSGKLACPGKIKNTGSNIAFHGMEGR